MSLYDSLMEMVLDESSTFYKAFVLSSKAKPHQNLDETLKKHSYPGYIAMYPHCKDMDDIDDLRKDINIGISTIKTVRNRIEKINKLGEDDPAVKGYVKGIKSMYIDKGITVKDCDETIKWFETVARQELNKRAKEIRGGK